MKRITETALLDSVNSLRKTSKVIEDEMQSVKYGTQDELDQQMGGNPNPQSQPPDSFRFTSPPNRNEPRTALQQDKRWDQVNPNSPEDASRPNYQWSRPAEVPPPKDKKVIAVKPGDAFSYDQYDSPHFRQDSAIRSPAEVTNPNPGWSREIIKTPKGFRQLTLSPFDKVAENIKESTMKKHNEQTLLESINSLRETIAVMEGPFDAIAKPVFNKAAEYVKPAFNAAKDYASWAKKGYNNPNLAKIQPNNTDAMHRGVRAGADANALVNSPNAQGAAIAGGAGAATLGTAAMYADKAEHPGASTPQDMSTHGGGYLDANNPGYKYHPYDDPNETGTVIGIDGSDDEDTGTVIGIDGDTSTPTTTAQNGAAPKGAAAHKTPSVAHSPAASSTYDPDVALLQQELVDKGYPLEVDGRMGPKTKAALDWDAKSQSRDAKIQGYDTAMQNMDPSNTQGDFNRHPELNEHVSFGTEDSLARILQLSKW